MSKEDLEELNELWHEQEMEEEMLECMSDEEVNKYIKVRYGNEI